MNDASAESLAYVRRYYSVPAEVGQAVEFEGDPGTIIGGQGPYVMIEFEGGEVKGPFHPLWHIDYLDGVDYGELFDAKIERFNKRLNTQSR